MANERPTENSSPAQFRPAHRNPGINVLRYNDIKLPQKSPHISSIWLYTANRMALLTVRAAAAQLGVAYSTLKRWVHTGVVRTTRTEGGHHRISDAEIDRLLARSAFAEASADKPGGAKASARKQPPTRSARSGQARSTRSARSGQ